MANVTTHRIEQQLQQLSSPQPEVKLVAPCKIGQGIITIDRKEALRLIDKLKQSTVSKAFFIPASGSGSRMFEFLFNFIRQPNEENRGQVERFLNHIEDFAFFRQFPVEVQKKLSEGTMDIDAFVAYILNDNGMGLAHLPKGLIAFHRHGPFLLNPFHEHILQGLEVCANNCSFHFTIRKAFEELIRERLQHMEGMTGKKPTIGFSEQNPDTDSIAFDDNNEPVYTESGEILRRPAGHGALLENLNQVDADIIFLKNIDNVQHFNHSAESVATQQALGGMLVEVQEKIGALLKNPSPEAIRAFNDVYQVFHPTDFEKSDDELIELLKRPVRICGMVRNEGQPGGGPFWISGEKGISKQIIEKAQISVKAQQFRLMIQSTHFNPVMLVCAGRLWNGEKVSFPEYRDDEKYFIVTKKYLGRNIRFTELPGLWNGSMAEWNSIFIEIPSTTFSPVKTILDLLDPAHTDR